MAGRNLFILGCLCRWVTSVNCMKNKSLVYGAISKFRSTFLGLFCLVLGALNLMAEQKFAEFETEGETYFNVTVTSKTPTHVFITHAQGFANIKVDSLSLELQEELGYQVAKVDNKAQSQLGLEAIPLDPEMAAARDKMVEDFKARFSGQERNILLAVVGILFAFYLFFCFCCKLICEKAGFKPGLLVWIPYLQNLALFKAARMGSWWFLLFISPFATPFLAKPIVENLGPQFIPLLLIPSGLMLVATLVWTFKICSARGIAPVAGILLWLPGINVLMFLYLAFSAPNPNAPISISREDTKRWSKTQAQDTSFFMNS